VSEHLVIYADPFEMTAHEVNQSIYRDAPDEQFLESVKSLGILEPILGMRPVGGEHGIIVLSGHRRMNAARMLGIEKVPVILHDVDSDDEAVRILILSNRQRDKTNEQMAREYTLLKEVEERLAGLRMTSGGESEDETGKAKVIAAKSIGMDYRTAEKALLVVEAMDEAEEVGDTAKLEDLRSKLNRSIAKGHKAVVRDRAGVVDGLKNPVPKEMEDVFNAARSFRGMIYKVGEVKASVRVLSEASGGELLPLREIEADCNNVSQALAAAAPWAVCPICKGGECNDCDHLGWMHKDQYEALPEGLRK
jgi:ParB-like chromosome segregation protein Spo0J